MGIGNRISVVLAAIAAAGALSGVTSAQTQTIGRRLQRRQPEGDAARQGAAAVDGPRQARAQGEGRDGESGAVGLTSEFNIPASKLDGFPVEAVFPKDGTALINDASGIIEGGPNPANARKFLDFINSKQAP